MSNLQKRRRQVTGQEPEFHWLSGHRVSDIGGEQSSPHSLCVEANEADLVYGKAPLALALEAPKSSDERANLNSPQESQGSALVKWQNGNDTVSALVDRCVN